MRELLSEIVCVLRDISYKLDGLSMSHLSSNREIALENYRLAYERQHGVSETPPQPYEDGSYDWPDGL